MAPGDSPLLRRSDEDTRRFLVAELADWHKRSARAAVVERALNAYLLGRILDPTQARSNLSEEEAERLAREELHAARRERGAA